MLQIKGGAYGARLSEAAALAAMMIIVDQAMTKLELTYELSSGIEGAHMIGSLHFIGHALDFTVRSTIQPKQSALLLADVKARLADDFDVTWTKAKALLHVEWQPKKPIGKLPA